MAVRRTVPKRRTAKQVAAQHKAAKASAAKRSRATSGKPAQHDMVTVYHATSEANAAQIIRGGFTHKPGQNRPWQMYPVPRNAVKQPIWVSTKAPSKGSDPSVWVEEKYGQHGTKAPVVLQFKVRKSLLRTDHDLESEFEKKTIPSKVVAVRNLKGVKIRKWKPPKGATGIRVKGISGNGD